jgi:hypothetical protein
LEGWVVVVGVVAGSLVVGVVGAVTGDVGLAWGVAAEQVVDAASNAVEIVGIAGQVVGGGDDDQVGEDASVRAPVPSVGGCVGLPPRLVVLDGGQPVGGVDDPVAYAVAVIDRPIVGGELETGMGGDCLPVVAVGFEDVVVMTGGSV